MAPMLVDQVMALHSDKPDVRQNSGARQAAQVEVDGLDALLDAVTANAAEAPVAA
jgi:hypothetical protein